MYKVHAVKLSGGKKRKPVKKADKVAQPVLVKNRHKRNPFEEEEKRKIANNVFKPFDIMVAQREGKSNNEIMEHLERALRHHFHKMTKSKQTGGSFFKRALSGINNIINRVKTAFTGRDNLQPVARKVLEQYGDERITNIVVHREPIISAINKIINILSLGRQEFDTLFHLYMVVTTDKGTKILIEKNHVINITTDVRPPKKGDETLSIPVSKNVTLNQLMEATKKYMGSNFLRYSAREANCQDMINSILTANGLNSETAKKFILQTPEQIFKHLPKGTSGVMDKITGLASKADVLLHGVGKKKQKGKGAFVPLMLRRPMPSQPVQKASGKKKAKKEKKNVTK